MLFQAPEGENQPSTEVDLFVSTEKIMVLNTDLQVYGFHSYTFIYVNNNEDGGMVEWLTHWTSNVRITSHMSLNPISSEPLFP